MKNINQKNYFRANIKKLQKGISTLLIKSSLLKIKKSTNKKGFIMAVLLISLPLFISCLMVFTSLLFCIRNHDLAQSICIRHTLQVQEKMKKALQDLLNLNPVANQLRQTQKHLEYLYREAIKTGELITISALRTQIEIIKQKRILLDKKQKNILNSTIRVVESSFNSFKRKLMKFHAGHIQKDHYQPIPLAVVGRPRGEIAPAYYPVPDFSSHQTFSFFWKMQLYRFLPKWLEKTFFQTQLSSYSCATTIKKRGLKWKTTLTSSLLLLRGFFT